jgi:hypothetical protein
MLACNQQKSNKFLLFFANVPSCVYTFTINIQANHYPPMYIVKIRLRIRLLTIIYLTDGTVHITWRRN